MNFKLTFIPDKAYYKEAYEEIISSFKLKKYEPVFATIAVIVGLALYFYDSGNKLGIFPFLISGFGIYEFYKFYNEKRKWLNDRLDSRISEQLFELEFKDTTIKHNGPFSNGEMQWNGLKDIIKTRNGILVKPENGISFYLPNRLFIDEGQIEFIMSKNKNSSL